MEINASQKVSWRVKKKYKKKNKKTDIIKDEI